MTPGGGICHSVVVCIASHHPCLVADCSNSLPLSHDAKHICLYLFACVCFRSLREQNRLAAENAEAVIGQNTTLRDRVTVLEKRVKSKGDKQGVCSFSLFLVILTIHLIIVACDVAV